MAVVSSPNYSAIKVKFDHGVNLNGDRIIKTKTYSGVKPNASDDSVFAVVIALVGLQEHSLSSVNRIDNTSLSE